MLWADTSAVPNYGNLPHFAVIFRKMRYSSSKFAAIYGNLQMYYGKVRQFNGISGIFIVSSVSLFLQYNISLYGKIPFSYCELTIKIPYVYV